MIDFKKLSKDRSMFHTYFDLDDLDVGVIPYEAVNKALRYEIFMRKYDSNTHWVDDFNNKILQSVLVRYPDYSQFLYDNAINGKSHKEFFKPYPAEILAAFEYLFPTLIKRLDKLVRNHAKLNQGPFAEVSTKYLN